MKSYMQLSNNRKTNREARELLGSLQSGSHILQLTLKPRAKFSADLQTAKVPTKQTCYLNLVGENGTLMLGMQTSRKMPLTVSSPQNPRVPHCPGFC